MNRVLWLLSLLCVAGTAMASQGDEDARFKECVAKCMMVPPHALSPTLRLTLWTWEDNCKYDCMHSIVASDVAAGRPIMQYHGKWPFVRWLGMQEPASVLFSLLNLLMYIVCGWRYFKHVADNRDHMNTMVGIYTVVGANAWFWSAVFHTRDLLVTERLDYFSATLLTVAGTYIAAVRVFSLRSAFARILLGIGFAIPYFAHVGYLALVRFDYGWNMTVNILIGVVHGLLWLGWWIAKKPTQAKWALAVVLLLSAGMCLELLDFAPIMYVIDAHSLWHAYTIFVVPLWFKFLAEDHNARHALFMKND